MCSFFAIQEAERLADIPMGFGRVRTERALLPDLAHNLVLFLVFAYGSIDRRDVRDLEEKRDELFLQARVLLFEESKLFFEFFSGFDVARRSGLVPFAVYLINLLTQILAFVVEFQDFIDVDGLSFLVLDRGADHIRIVADECDIEHCMMVPHG